ncbi:hypothetical protein CR513_04714, partial [Mucuna pruriens]
MTKFDHPTCVTKLLAAGIIYSILDSQWVSLVQVVPKKFGMIVMKNQHGELVPMRIQNSWRVCINYRRLNQVTHKDQSFAFHTPSPGKTSRKIPLLFPGWIL